MKITVLTLFPEFFDSFLNMPIIKRAEQKGVCEIEIIDIKKYATGSFRHIDDSPFGGGVGMIMRCQPVFDALNAVAGGGFKILLSPKGSVYNQKKARELSRCEHIVLICGHYEGIDARVETVVDEQLSIGDFVLTGGEIAAETVIDSVVRLLDGILRKGSADDESHETGLLEYPQYTQPREYNGMKVPEILLSGDRKKISEWQRVQSLRLTEKYRHDMYEKYNLSEYEKKLLKKYE